jgi:hypothetical protein
MAESVEIERVLQLALSARSSNFMQYFSTSLQGGVLKLAPCKLVTTVSFVLLNQFLPSGTHRFAVLF